MPRANPAATFTGTRYPFSINTDDSGVFDTDLPTEFAHLAASNEMGKEEIANLACRAVQVNLHRRTFCTALQHLSRKTSQPSNFGRSPLLAFARQSAAP